MTTGTNQEVYTNDDHEANEATLVARWERILQDEGLSPLEADGLLVDGDTLYLGVAGTTADGIDLPGETDVELFDGEAEEEISTPVVPSSPVLLPEDFEVLANLHASREAMTLDEAEASPESIVRLAAAGFARGHIAEEGDVVVLATAGATDRDVWRAVNRARCDEIEASFLADIATCEEIAEGVLRRVGHLGGACDERELVESFTADHPREAMEATLAELTRRGAVRRIANRKSSVRLVADPEADGEAHVNVQGERVHVEYDPERVGVGRLVEAVREAGFDAGGASLRLKVTGLYCSACVSQIEGALKASPGVLDATMNAATEEVKVDYLPTSVDLGALERAVEEAGQVSWGWHDGLRGRRRAGRSRVRGESRASGRGGRRPGRQSR